MIRPPLIVLFLGFFCSCNTQPPTPIQVGPADTVRILTYGLIRTGELDAMQSVAKKYGCRYYTVGGCLVSPHLVDSVRRENEKAYAILKKRYGPDWRMRMEATIRKELAVFRRPTNWH